VAAARQPRDALIAGKPRYGRRLPGLPSEPQPATRLPRQPPLPRPDAPRCRPRMPQGETSARRAGARSRGMTSGPSRG